MARVEFNARVAEDFDRILDHLIAHDVQHADSRVADIVTAIETLHRNPLIGRPTHGEKRELIIGRGTRGYIALYRYAAELDIVFVLGVRAQSEAGYARPL